MAIRRNARAGVEDRRHRPAHKDEVVRYPADAGPGEPIWCTDPRHGTPGTQVSTQRHGQGQRWQARWVGEGLERSKSFAKKADAERHLRGVVADLETGNYADPQRSAVTFGTVAESWLKTKEAANRAPKTIGGYRGLLDVAILPKWREARLRDITHERPQDWVTWLSTDPAARQHKRKDSTENAGLSPARVIQIHQVVSQVLGYALRGQVRGQQRRGPPAATLGTMVRFLAYSGLRFGEYVALRVADIDTGKRRVLVSRSVTQVRGRGRIEGDTKTHQRRAVPILTTALTEELSRLIEGRDPGEFLFPGPDGGAMSIRWFRVRFDRAVATLGVAEVTPRTLRHSAGSLALQSGASVATVQKLLG
jgi:integrase